MLKPSASRARCVFSVMAKRREMRRSTYFVAGILKKLLGRSAKRSEPFEPLTPPAWLKPKTELTLDPEVLPVKRAPENMLTTGAIVQPLKIARPTVLSLRLAKFVL